MPEALDDDDDDDDEPAALVSSIARESLPDRWSNSSRSISADVSSCICTCSCSRFMLGFILESAASSSSASAPRTPDDGRSVRLPLAAVEALGRSVRLPPGEPPAAVAPS